MSCSLLLQETIFSQGAASSPVHDVVGRTRLPNTVPVLMHCFLLFLANLRSPVQASHFYADKLKGEKTLRMSLFFTVAVFITVPSHFRSFSSAADCGGSACKSRDIAPYSFRGACDHSQHIRVAVTDAQGKQALCEGRWSKDISTNDVFA